MRPPLTPRLTFLAIGLLAAGLLFTLYRSTHPLVQQVDLRLKDARFLLRGPRKPDQRVAIVAVDNRSVKELGRWPWSRELTARLIRELKRGGARVIALDMVFSEPQAAGPDAELARSVAEAGNVVLGQFFRDEPQPADAEILRQLESARIKQLRVAAGVDRVPLTEYLFVDGNLSSIGRGALDFGFFNQQADGDGLYRKIPLLFLFQGEIYSSLGLVALKRYQGGELALDVESYGIDSLRLGQQSIPVSEQGLLPLFWYGTRGSIPTYSAADLLAGRVADGALRDRLVFVGVTETGIADVRPTPFDPQLPGVEIHATFAANALEGRFLTRDNRTLGVEMAAILCLPLLLCLILSAAPGTWAGLAAFMGISGGYLAANLFAFSRYRLDLTLAYPLASLLAAYLGGEVYRNLVVERKGRYLRRAFGSYVSPDLVAELVRHPERLRLGGERRELTVLFSDIRGFTTLSEGLSPEELVSLLNRYLSPMTRLVLEEKGTLDKYIGDAVMALFNAPLELEDHPTRACSCAVRMLEALRELNETLTRDRLPAIAIGIGIHTGQAVVGNMGADNRFDYTAIGDSVNLASRLESLTKRYGVPVIVSGDTRQRSRGEFHFRELDLVRVKGKQQPVAIFELRGAPYPRQEQYDQALSLYRRGEFAAAEALFTELAGALDDRAARLYADRCGEYRRTPPPEGWDGVFTMQEK
jgi:adenylate cyclase